MTTPTLDTFVRIGAADEVDALARRILDPARPKPLVVVTSLAGATGGREASVPFDPKSLFDEIGDVAEVVLLPTGELSMRLDQQLPDMTQVYGGAGRCYPVGFGAAPDWRRSPLRFPGPNAARNLERLIGDVIEQAHAAGLFDHAPARAVAVSGEVRGVLANGERALVRLDSGGLATVWADLIFGPVPLEWALAPGCRVHGMLDESTNRLALDPIPVDAASLAAAFPHGCVTLALVIEAGPEHAVLTLHPDHRIRVHRADVSPNPLDRVDLLLTDGDVVPVRVVHLSTGALHLRLSDVDDDEPLVASLPLFEGATPWLVADRRMPAPSAERADDGDDDHDEGSDRSPHGAVLATAPEPDAVPASLSAAEPGTGRAPEPEASVQSTPPTTVRPIPGPGPRRVVAAPAATAPPATAPTPTPVAPARPPVPSADAPVPRGGAVKALELSLEAERAARRRAEERLAEAGLADSDLARMRTTAALDRQRVRELLAENGDLRRRVTALTSDRSEASRRLRAYAHREVGLARSSPSRQERRARFADDESWLRHELACAWVARVDASDKARYPLAEFVVGPSFAASLERFDEGQFDKALKAAVDVLTGRADQLSGRELHRRRVSSAGGAPYLVREDGAYAMRCAIERNTSSARRLHYWVLPGGEIELNDVSVHDSVLA